MFGLFGVNRLNPTGPKDSPCCPGYSSLGDTLTGIARRLNVSRQAILDLNNGLEASRLRIGQKIKIPSSTQESSKTAKDKFSLLPSKQSLPSLPSSEVSPQLVSINLLGVAPSNSDSDPSWTSTRRLFTKIKNATLDTVDLLWPVETRTISSAWGPRIRSATVKLSNGIKKGFAIKAVIKVLISPHSPEPMFMQRWMGPSNEWAETVNLAITS